MDELKEAGTQALLGIIESVTTAANFLKGEIPIAVQELLTYYTAWYVVALTLWLLVGALGIGLWRYMRSERCLSRFPESAAYHTDQNDLMFYSWILFTAGIAAILLPSLYYLPKVLKITLAPRIWLIEYATNLVR